MDELVLHEYAPSGNCYKIRLTAAHLGRPLQRIHYDILKGETQTPEWRARINPTGQTPTLQVGDRMLPESNAAIWWLAEGTPLLPADAWGRAEALRWLFWEQYKHEPNIATLRFWRTYGGGVEAQSAARQASVADREAAGEAALALMDGHLAERDWFVGEAFSVADIALYAYTHVAGEGGFELARYPAVVAWCGRVASLPGHVAITD